MAHVSSATLHSARRVMHGWSSCSWGVLVKKSEDDNLNSKPQGSLDLYPESLAS